MNIQPSIIVWTVICFVLLMLILNNLLFKPVLHVIDARKQRVEAARAKKQSRECLLEQMAEQKLAAERENAARAEAESRQKVEKIQQDGKREVQKAQKKRLDMVNKYREQMKEEHEQIVKQVTPEMESVAKLFADVLVSDRV